MNYLGNVVWETHWGPPEGVIFGFEFDAILAEALENWLDRWRTSDEGIEVPR